MSWKPSGVSLDTLPAGSKIEASVDGSAVLLVRLSENVYAFEPYCTHEGGILAEGELSDNRLKCPLHGAVFEMPSGTVLEDPDGVVPPQGVASPLRTYPTRIQDGIIEVDLD